MIYLDAKETYVSFDIETDGQIPGKNSMRTLGAVAYDHVGNEIDTWYNRLQPLRDAETDSETMEWWTAQPLEAFAEAFEGYKLRPTDALTLFDGWLSGLPGKKVLMANPGNWDGMFVTWYAQWVLGRYLCTKHRVLDMRSFTMGALGGGFMENGRDDLRKRFKEITDANPFPHHALHDAREQGQQFFAVVAEARLRAEQLRNFIERIEDTAEEQEECIGGSPLNYRTIAEDMRAVLGSA